MSPSCYFGKHYNQIIHILEYLQHFGKFTDNLKFHISQARPVLLP